MPKLVIGFILIFGGIFAGVLIHLLSFIQLFEHELSKIPSADVGLGMSFGAFVLFLVDKIFSYLAKRKKEKSEEHLEAIRNEMTKQTVLLGEVITINTASSEIARQNGKNIAIALDRQQNIYSRFLKRPPRGRLKKG